jgi:putative hydrolase of the HAD superfamily
MEFNRIYKIKTPSSTEAAALLSGLSVYEAAIECEQYKDRRAFLSYDKKLVSMFEALSRYRHFLFTNGIRGKIIESLAVLGVSPSTFQEIVTPELVKVNKPQPEGFLHILKKTGLPPTSHLMIGDREAVDIEPARALGMKTCLVFSDKKSKVADITLHTVYKFADYARSHS